jgi:hypothetical protein
MSLFSKILLISLTVFSDSLILRSYKLIKPFKLSRSNTPIYLSQMNKNSSNYLKLNDDGSSINNNNNKLFNLSDYNFKLNQLLNFSSFEDEQKIDKYNNFYLKSVSLLGLSEYDLILLKIIIIVLINAYLIALIVDYSLYYLLKLH